MKKIFSAFIGISIALYFLTLFIAYIDSKFTYRWEIFCLYILSIVLILICWLIQHKQELKSYTLSVFKTKEIKLLFILFFLGAIVSFLFINQYPFVSIADEMRDSGLWAKRMINYSGINIFSYGSYNGYGLVASVFVIPFYFLFGNSVLSYRSLTAILAILDVLLLYILARYNFQSKQSAFWAALILLLLPLHMFYGRTESLVAFDSFLTIVLFILFSVWLRRRTLIDYIFLGTMIGFTLNFHTAVRVAALLVVGLVLFFTFKTLFSKVNAARATIVDKVALFVLFCFVGFGPTFLFSNTGNFFQSNRYAYSKNAYLMNYIPASDKFDTFKINYIRSLMVWFYEPTTSHYSSHKPIFSPFIGIFFLIGIGYALLVLKNPFLYAALFFMLILTFTNSAMTDWVNADHRLAPMFFLGALFAGIGIAFCVRSIKYRFLKVILVIIVMSYLFWQAAGFFVYRSADQTRDHELKDHLAMHIYYFLQEHEQDFASSKSPTPLCISVSPNSSQLMNAGHVGNREQLEYFIPNKLAVHFIENTSVKDNEAYIMKGDCQEAQIKEIKRMKLIDCSSGSNFTCPLNYFDQIRIYY